MLQGQGRGGYGRAGGGAKLMTLKRTAMARGTTPLRATAPLRRSVVPMNRGAVALARGTASMSRSKGLDRSAAQMQRSVPLKSKMPSERSPAQAKAVVVQSANALPIRKKKLKTNRPKMTPIRSSAKNEECTLRFPCCNYRTDTTVLCHRNGAGAGMKAPDTDAAYGCYACHMVLDGHAPRPEGFTREMMLARFEVAVELTHIRLAVKGLIELVGAAEKGGVEKQKPTPVTSRDRLQLEVTDWGSQMSTKIVPQNNSVVGASARSDADFPAKDAIAEVAV